MSNYAKVYLTDTGILFVGVFTVCTAMEACNVHKRIALVIIDKIGKTEDNTATKEPEKTEAKSNVLPNDLRHFASYNYIFTLSALTSKEINSPDTTYRKGKTEFPFIKSGGGVKPLVPSRQREYFIDNVQHPTLTFLVGNTYIFNLNVLKHNIHLK